MAQVWLNFLFKDLDIVIAQLVTSFNFLNCVWERALARGASSIRLLPQSAKVVTMIVCKDHMHMCPL